MSANPNFKLLKTQTVEDFLQQFGGIELMQPMSREDYFELVEAFPELQIERETNGTIQVMSPLKKGSSKRESNLHGMLFMWNFTYGNGEVYGANGTFDLPNGATKMPDVSWISPKKVKNQSENEETYIKTVPDFVAEIRSASDKIEKLKTKMTDSWMENGVRLAWLIDPYDEIVYIYRQGSEVEELHGFAGKKISGEAVLPGFLLDLETMQRR